MGGGDGQTSVGHVVIYKTWEERHEGGQKQRGASFGGQRVKDKAEFNSELIQSPLLSTNLHNMVRSKVLTWQPKNWANR